MARHRLVGHSYNILLLLLLSLPRCLIYPFKVCVTTSFVNLFFCTYFETRQSPKREIQNEIDRRREKLEKCGKVTFY